MCPAVQHEVLQNVRRQLGIARLSDDPPPAQSAARLSAGGDSTGLVGGSRATIKLVRIASPVAGLASQRSSDQPIVAERVGYASLA